MKQDMKKPKAILIFGPAGSGKTSTANRIGENKGWVHISEDEYWGEIKKNRPEGELRTHEEQKIIWQRVLRDIKKNFRKGKNVALEFLVYEDPPKPLLFYKKELSNLGAKVIIRILNPPINVNLARRIKRGLPHDLRHLKRKLKKEKCLDDLQRDVLDSRYIKKDWIINNGRYSIEEIYQKFFAEFVESKGMVSKK